MINELADLIIEKGKPENIRGKILKMVSRGRFLEKHSPNIHPLGYMHIKLGESDRGAAVRLHIWPRDERPYQAPRLPIHDHVWILDSHVLTGVITNRIYNTISSNFDPTHQLFDVQYEGDKDVSVLRPTENFVRAEVSEETKYYSGDHYSVSLDTYHTSQVPESKFTSTVVATSDSKNRAPKVLGPVDRNETFVYQRESYSDRVAKKYIEKLSRKISPNTR